MKYGCIHIALADLWHKSNDGDPLHLFCVCSHIIGHGLGAGATHH
jgi:hypothetical protein